MGIGLLLFSAWAATVFTFKKELSGDSNMPDLQITYRKEVPSNNEVVDYNSSQKRSINLRKPNQ